MLGVYLDSPDVAANTTAINNSIIVLPNWRTLMRRVLGFVCGALVLAAAAQALASGINTTDPNLPPIPSTYLTPDQVHAMYSGPGLAVILSKVEHKPFALKS